MLPIGDDNSHRRIIPVVTWALVILNFIVFFIEMSGGDEFIYTWSFTPAYFTQNPGGFFITVFTAMFMHGGWMHLLSNMLYLIIFGDNVEDRFGHVKFLIFYLVCGVIATFVQYFAAPYIEIPNLGASGAIAGVLGAYIILFPARRVRVLVAFWVVRMPAVIVIGVWIALQLLSSMGSVATLTGSTGGVAYMAHIGGFFAGLVLSFFFRKRQTQYLPPPYVPS